MNEKTELKELILFCQLVSYAYESKLPFGKALLVSAETADMAKPAQWCRQIAKRLSEGYTVSEAVKELHNLDPVLSGLLPLLGENKLMLIFQTYTKFLASVDIVKSKLRVTMYYPLILQVFLVLNLIVLNLKFFPEFYVTLVEQGRGIPLIMHLLYFAQPALWPISLILPVIICYYLWVSLKLTFSSTWNSYFTSGIVGFLGMKRALKTLMEARLQAIIALYISAGNSIEYAIGKAMESEPIGANKVCLHRVKHLLENGLSVNIAFEESQMLEYFAEEGDTAIENLSERLLSASDANFRTAEKNLVMYENMAGVIAIILAGFFVMLVTVGFFSPYFFAVSGANP